jgi:uncharacterized protein (TIGR02246 family)
MTTQDQNQAEVQALLDRLIAAARRKDLAAVMACYAEDAVLFDLMPPLRITGATAYRKNWQAAFQMTEGPFGIELRDVAILASGDLACSHALQRVTAVSKENGEKIDFWLRQTVAFRKTADGWRIVHEHGSVPVDMTNDAALFDLKP